MDDSRNSSGYVNGDSRLSTLLWRIGQIKKYVVCPHANLRCIFTHGCFMGKFSKSPMHFFGSLGTLLFGVGFVSAAYLGIRKMIFMYQGYLLMKLTDNPFFYLSLTCMILGTQLFLAGFISELVSRSSGRSNEYGILKMVGLTDDNTEVI